MQCMQEVEKVRPLPEFATNHGLGNLISFSFFKKKNLKVHRICNLLLVSFLVKFLIISYFPKRQRLDGKCQFLWFQWHFPCEERVFQAYKDKKRGGSGLKPGPAWREERMELPHNQIQLLSLAPEEINIQNRDKTRKI